MTTAMFGVPLGFRTYDEDAAKLALMGAQTQHQQALTRLNDTQGAQIRAKMEAEAEQRARLQKLMQLEAGEGGSAGGPVGLNPTDPASAAAALGGAAQPTRAAPAGSPLDPDDAFQQSANALRRKGELYLKAGMLKEGGDALKEASQIHSAVATARSNRALEQRRRAETSLKVAERLAEIFVDVDSPEAHRQAVMSWYNDPALGGQRLPKELETFDPEAIRRAVGASKVFIEKQKLVLQQAAEQRMTQTARDNIEMNRVRKGVLTGRLDLDREAEERRRAAGGNSRYASANDDDREAARRMIIGMGYNLEDLGDESVTTEYAYRFADRARQLVASNKGVVSMEQALAQVVVEAQETGEIPRVPESRKPSPTVLGVPLPVPRGADKIDRSKAPKPAPKDGNYVKGEFYTEEGGIYEYLGDGKFRTVRRASDQPTGKPAGAPPPKPAGGKPRPLPTDPSQLEAGAEYVDSKGRVMVFDGSKFVAPKR